MEYILGPKEDGCIFCDKAGQSRDRENMVLFRGEQAFVLMNLYPYNNGHLMIAPYTHCPTTRQLGAGELTEIMLLADRSMEVLEDSIKAQGFNFGANIGRAGGAGIEKHVHFHLVPRWMGDTNYMPVVGHTKVMVQGLLETYDTLKPHFDRLNRKGD